MLNRNPVNRILRKYVHICESNEDYQRKLVSLDRVAKSEEWKTVIQILWTIKNEMAVEMLESKKFTELSPDEKDKAQKVYSNINEWINFLTNPMGWIGKNGLIGRLTTNLFKGDSQTQP